MSDPESDAAFSDYDTCDVCEINELFRKSCSVAEEIIDNNKYILHISSTKESSPKIALGLSKNECQIHNLTNCQLAKISSYVHDNLIIDCKFSLENTNILFTGSTNDIKMWDTRQPEEPGMNFIDTSSQGNDSKDFTCFDISNNGRLLTAGTDLYLCDAYILFWDIRKANLLGGYWESHTDDITQVKFHSNSNTLMSGSTDGLINIYDLSQTSEEDALLDTLNTNSSIEKLTWYNVKNADAISCITHTVNLLLWKIDQTYPYKQFARKDIANEMRRTSGDNVYIVNTHSAESNLLTLVGSNANDGECLRGLEITNQVIRPFLDFQSNQQLVRCSWFNENANVLFTGGEKGILNVWKISSCS